MTETTPKRRGRPPKPETVKLYAHRAGLWSSQGKSKAGDVIEVPAAEAETLLGMGFWRRADVA